MGQGCIFPSIQYVNEKTFYITDMITSSVSTIIYPHYIRIMSDDELNAGLVESEDLEHQCFELDIQTVRKRWEDEQRTVEIEGMDKINVPGLHGVDFDPCLPRSLKLTFCRGFEL